MRGLFNLIGFIILCMIIVSIPILIGFIIISIFIVPLTWLYAQITGQSYSFICDQSELLYRLNKYGKIALFCGLCYLVFHIFILCL